MVLLPCDDDYNPARGSPPEPIDLDLSRWFSQAQIISKVDYFPGTSCWLRNGYAIIAVRQPSGCSPRIRPSSSPANTAVHEMFSMHWMGNIIVVKRGRRARHRVVNITRSEISLVNALVHRYYWCLLRTYSMLMSLFRWLQLETERLGL